MTVHTDTDMRPVDASSADEASAYDDTTGEVDDAKDVGKRPEGGDDGVAGKGGFRGAMSLQRQALLIGVLIIAALAGLAGWLGWRVYQSHHLAREQAVLLQAGRQGALNLTTIDWQHADADVQRILNSATGTFYDDFSKRSQPFIDVLKQSQSKSEGTITAAALESASGTQAQVLVAVSVKVSNAGAPEQHPRAWRMRISVQNVGDDVKVSNVEFVP